MLQTTLSGCSNIRTIDEYSFYSCDVLSEVILPPSIVTIEDYAFSFCYELKTIDFAECVNLESLGDYTFRYCRSLESINLKNCIELIRLDGDTFSECSQLTSVLFPSSIRVIGGRSFEKCSKLKMVDLSACTSLSTIGKDAFIFCNSLAIVILPSSLRYIREGAFYGCDGLERIILLGSYPPEMGNSLPTFGYVDLNTPIYVPVDVVEEYKNSPWWSTFTNIQAGGICGDLIFWEYNDGVLVVNGIGAMTNYASKDEVPWAPIREDITKVIIGSGITTVGAFAFNGCTNLVDLTLPVDLTSIENNAFEMCTKLKNLDLSDCTELTFIGRFAFKDCNSLTNLALPVSLTNIGYGAFYDCTSLAQISSLATTPPTIEIDDTTPVFGNVDKTIPVYVPVGSVDAHKAADGWKEFVEFVNMFVISNQ